jgi:hypothetical protein
LESTALLVRQPLSVFRTFCEKTPIIASRAILQRMFRGVMLSRRPLAPPPHLQAIHALFIITHTQLDTLSLKSKMVLVMGY